MSGHLFPDTLGLHSSHSASNPLDVCFAHSPLSGSTRAM